jgi:hypothetical protein
MYDANGKLITGGLSAGTADRRSPEGGGFAEHQRIDVHPFIWAEDVDRVFRGRAYRNKYIEVRPPNTGLALEHIVD